MKRTQIILIFIGTLAVAGLYSLPKVVVDNKEDEKVNFVNESIPGGEITDHSSEIPEEI